MSPSAPARSGTLRETTTPPYVEMSASTPLAFFSVYSSTISPDGVLPNSRLPAMWVAPASLLDEQFVVIMVKTIDNGIRLRAITRASLSTSYTNAAESCRPTGSPARGGVLDGAHFGGVEVVFRLDVWAVDLPHVDGAGEFFVLRFEIRFDGLVRVAVQHIQHEPPIVIHRRGIEVGHVSKTFARYLGGE